MVITKRDFLLVGVIGLGVGLLAQSVLLNTIESLHKILPLPFGVIRATTLVFFVLLAPVALAIAGFIGKKLPFVYQFAKFAAVGSLNGFVDLGIFNLQTYLYAADIKTLSTLAFFGFKSLSFLAGTTNSYFWNKFWTFGDKNSSHANTIFIFYAITGFNYLLNAGVATGLKAIGPLAGVPANVWVNVLAPIAGIFSAMFANFFAYKYLVFRDTQGA